FYKIALEYDPGYTDVWNNIAQSFYKSDIS
ncbi:unnamed protein product, partial [marine sediment metagenome]